MHIYGRPHAVPTRTPVLMPALICPKCASAMEEGFLLDKTDPTGFPLAPEWAEGTPEPSMWTGLKLKGRVRHKVTTYRCTHCGFLESYAPGA